MTHRPTPPMADRIDFALQAERQRNALRQLGGELGPFLTFDLSRCPERHRDTVRAHLASMSATREQRRREGILSETEAVLADRSAQPNEPTRPRPGAKLGDLIRQLTPAELAERDRATHRLDGKCYEELTGSQKHGLMLSDRERFNAMRDDWHRRGKPLAGEPKPANLIGALRETAKLCGIDWNAPPAPRRHLEVVPT